MPTMLQMASARRKSLRILLQLSRRVNTAQEALDREIKRIINRKQAVPELKDMERIVDLCATVEAKTGDVSEGALSIARDWTNA